jgi:hypothetical protein
MAEVGLLPEPADTVKATTRTQTSPELLFSAGPKLSVTGLLEKVD